MGVIEIVNKQKYEEGFKIGIEQGYETGIEQGIEIARRKANEEVKKRINLMRQKGISLELIADFLLLSTNEVIAFFKDLDIDLLNAKKE